VSCYVNSTLQLLLAAELDCKSPVVPPTPTVSHLLQAVLAAIGGGGNRQIVANVKPSLQKLWRALLAAKPSAFPKGRHGDAHEACVFLLNQMLLPANSARFRSTFTRTDTCNDCKLVSTQVTHDNHIMIALHVSTNALDLQQLIQDHLIPEVCAQLSSFTVAACSRFSVLCRLWRQTAAVRGADRKRVCCM